MLSSNASIVSNGPEKENLYLYIQHKMYFYSKEYPFNDISKCGPEQGNLYLYIQRKCIFTARSIHLMIYQNGVR